MILGGAASVELAASIAERRAWWMRPAHGGRFCVAEPPVLRWRDRAWPLRAIDGWERVATPWWDRAHDVAPAELYSLQLDCCGQPSEIQMGGADVTGSAAEIARLSGRLYARLQIGSGLWIFVRFPERIASTREVSARVESTRPISEAVREVVVAAEPDRSYREERCSHDPCSHDLWIVRCRKAFDIGLPISILGAWG